MKPVFVYDTTQGKGDPNAVPIVTNMKIIPYPPSIIPLDNNNTKTADTPFEVLKRLRNCFISQKYGSKKNPAGCCDGFRYRIYDDLKFTDGDHIKSIRNLLFRCKEESGSCERCCCKASNRGFTMTMDYAQLQLDPTVPLDGKRHKSIWHPFLVIEKKCTLNILCVCRPGMDVFHIVNGKKEHIGTIENRCSCCNNVFEINAKSGQHFVTGDTCQCGMWCHCNTQDCKEVHFLTHKDLESEGHTGTITKVFHDARFF